MKGQPVQNSDVPQQVQPQPDYQEIERQQRSELAREYDEAQRLARIQQQKEHDAMVETNPHEKYVDVISDRSPKGKFKMTLIGRPIDLFKLEDYLIFTMSPRTNITLMRYNEVKAWEDAQGYGRHSIVKKKRGLGGMFFIIIMIIIMLVVGVVFLMYGPQIIQGMSGMFGGF